MKNLEDADAAGAQFGRRNRAPDVLHHAERNGHPDLTNGIDEFTIRLGEPNGRDRCREGTGEGIDVNARYAERRRLGKEFGLARQREIKSSFLVPPKNRQEVVGHSRRATAAAPIPNKQIHARPGTVDRR